MATTSATGLVITGDNQVSQLYNANRDYNNRLVWQDLYNSNSLAGSKAVSQLQNSYTDATTQAYISYLQGKNALASSGVVGSAKASALAAYDTSLQSTMDSYASSLSEGVTSINDAVSENQTAITEALQEQADYTADYTNAHYSYLEQLYEDYLNGENTLFDSKVWEKYLTDDTDSPSLDDEGNLVYDDEGNQVYDQRLKSWEELANPAYEESTDEYGNTLKEYTSLFDENGNLTGWGTDFFDQLENTNGISNDYTSWTQYLANTNEDLYNWATSYNYYNYTADGTNMGTVKTMYGMMSDDYTYSYAERMGGMTTSQIEDTFSSFNEAVNKFSDYSDSREADELADYVTDVMTSLNDLLVDLGIDKDIEETYNMSLDDYITEVTNIGNSAYNLDGGWTWAQYVASFATFTGMGTMAGTMYGGPIGGVIGAIVGAIMGTVVIWGTDNTRKNENEEYSAQVKQLYDQIVVNLADYVHTRETSRNTPTVIY